MGDRGYGYREPGAARARAQRRWVVALAASYALLLLLLSLMPVPQVARQVGSPMGHALAYGLPVAVLAPLLGRRGDRLALALALWGFGAAVEGLQALVDWRSGKLEDVAWNTVGVLGGLMAAHAIERLWRGLGDRGRG